MQARLRMVPGSEEDIESYLTARSIDELTRTFDTMDKQAAVSRLNRNGQQA
jgi:hypothetical protein